MGRRPSGRRRRRCRADRPPRDWRTASRGRGGLRTRDRRSGDAGSSGAGAAPGRPSRLPPRRQRSRAAARPRSSSDASGKRRLEELADDAERELALELGAPRAQHPHAAARPPLPHRGEQRRLPDAGRPLDDDEPAAPGAGLVQGAVDPRQLVAPLEQRSGGPGPPHKRRAYSPATEKSGGLHGASPAVRTRQDRGDPELLHGLIHQEADMRRIARRRYWLLAAMAVAAARRR